MSDAGDYKVVLVGDLEVGKTTLFNRFKEGKFVDSGDERQTRQQAECKKTWTHDGEQFTVSFKVVAKRTNYVFPYACTPCSIYGRMMVFIPDFGTPCISLALGYSTK